MICVLGVTDVHRSVYFILFIYFLPCLGFNQWKDDDWFEDMWDWQKPMFSHQRHNLHGEGVLSEWVKMTE